MLDYMCVINFRIIIIIIIIIIIKTKNWWKINGKRKMASMKESVCVKSKHEQSLVERICSTQLWACSEGVKDSESGNNGTEELAQA